jgi:WD40 repeat protein
MHDPQHPQGPAAGPTDHDVSRRALIAAGATVVGAALLRPHAAGGATLADAADETLAVPPDRVFGPAHVHPDRPTCVVALSNTVAVATDEQGRVRAWNITANPVTENSPAFKARGAKKASYVAAAKDLVFSASYESVVNVLEASGMRNLKYPFEQHLGQPQVWCVAVSDDGTHAVSSTNAGEIRRWKTADGSAVGKEFYYSNEPVGGLAFIPGKTDEFLSGHGHGEVVWWKPGATDPVVFFTFPHDTSYHVNSVAVSPNGKFAASGSFDRTVRIWDLANPNKTPVHVFTDHTDLVWRVAFSPDNKLVASASEDGTVRVYRVGGTWPEHAAPRTERGGVMGVAFTPDNKIVYTAGDKNDPSVRYWPIEGAP